MMLADNSEIREVKSSGFDKLRYIRRRIDFLNQFSHALVLRGLSWLSVYEWLAIWVR